MSSHAEWVRFFTLAGIPQGIAAKYANSFVENRMAKRDLTDLDKSTLAELGITAVGDQLAVLRRIRASGSAHEVVADPAPTPANKSIRTRISAPDEEMLIDDSPIVNARKGKPAPDRHEIYHIKMPQGTTQKTRNILRTTEQLRNQGLYKRSTTGVRQAGRTVMSVAEQRAAEMADLEVSSSTDSRFGGLRSDRILAGRVKKAPRGGLLFTTAVASAVERPTKRMQIQLAGARKPKLPQVTLQIGGGRSIQKRVTKPGVQVYDEADIEEYEDELEEEEFVDETAEYEDVYEDEVDEEDLEEDESSMLVVRPTSTRQARGRRPPRAVYSRVTYETAVKPQRAAPRSVFNRISL